MNIEGSVVLHPHLIEYDPAELDAWTKGDRSGCSDSYCKKSLGSRGFGEYIVGTHFEKQGYEWIHHDFDLFGTNAPGKYPRSESALEHCLGGKKLKSLRQLYNALQMVSDSNRAPIESPDLLLFKRDSRELRFAEVKRLDTGDKLNRPAQILGLVVLGVALKCPVEVFIVAPRGKVREAASIRFNFNDC